MSTTGSQSETTTIDPEVLATTVICKLVLTANGKWAVEDPRQPLPKAVIVGEALDSTSGVPTPKKIKKIEGIGITRTDGSDCWYCALPDGTLWGFCFG